MKEEKTHWKKAFKSNYLSSSDIIKDTNLVIAKVELLKCKTQSGVVECNVATFTDSKYKPMILNVGNSKIVKKFANDDRFLENWKDIPITIFVDNNVRFGNQTVEGLRIKNQQHKEIVIENLTPEHKKWNNVVSKLKKGSDINAVKQYFIITDENLKLLQDASK